MKERITIRRLDDKRKGLTDWARVDAMTEEELERAIAADPDSDPPVDWTKAQFIVRGPKESVHLRIDPDVLAWFRRQGRGYLTRMNAVLRAYMDAHQPR